VVGNIINNILQNKNLNIKANNKVTRSFMYSDDLTRWLLKILDNSNIHCPVYNVGSDDAVDIHETALLLAKKYNLSIKSSAINRRATDTYIPIIYKAKKQLGLKNKLNSFQAIIKTVDLLKKNYETS
jgi:nucleoside-diphosphate-sugar epimerase